MKPFFVTPQQASPLPRWLLLGACLLYAIPGLLGRDPWRFDDATGFGLAWTMSQSPRGVADWLMPNVVGMPIFEEGPLPFWLGALMMRTLPFLPASTAMRLATLLWVGLFLVLLWQSTRLLTQRSEVQPFDPFGASAGMRDYGRALADSALLLAMACFGLLARIHETTAESAIVTWIALYLFGMALSLERPRIGGCLAGIAVALAALTRGLPTAAALILTTTSLVVGVRAYRLLARPLLSTLLPSAALGVTLWLAPLYLLSPDTQAYLARWLGWNQWLIAGPTREVWLHVARTTPWFFWPTWPFTTWALWRWRDRLAEPALALPMLCAVWLLVVALIAPHGSDSTLIPIIVPMTMLAALSLPTIRRSVVSLIDWFAVTTFSLIGLALWMYWLAFQTGWPNRMAARVQAALPGFTPYLNALEIILGIAVTIAWIALVIWRVQRHPKALWRAVALSAGGMVLTWCLLMTLWLPAANFRKTYRDVAQQIGHVVAVDHRCVRTRGIDVAQRASLAYFGQLRLTDTGDECEWLLVFDRADTPLDAAGLRGRWRPIWSGQRPADRRERFRLFRRSPS